MKSKLRKIILSVSLMVFAFFRICEADIERTDDKSISHENLFEGFVYFTDKQKTALKSVNKKFASNLDSHDLGLEILKTLVQGPQQDELEATWPKGTTIDAFFITDDGKAYVDLGLERAMMETMDTREELLAIHSLVNSLTLNISGIQMVKILIQGQDAETLAGHIDLEYFFKTKLLMGK